MQKKLQEYVWIDSRYGYSGHGVKLLSFAVFVSACAAIFLCYQLLTADFMGRSDVVIIFIAADIAVVALVVFGFIFLRRLQKAPQKVVFKDGCLYIRYFSGDHRKSEVAALKKLVFKPCQKQNFPITPYGRTRDDVILYFSDGYTVTLNGDLSASAELASILGQHLGSLENAKQSS